MSLRNRLSLPLSAHAPRLTHLLILVASCAAFASFVALSPARAQQDEDDVVRVNTDLVVLNVTVTDKEGKYVHKLSRADFKVLEDKREQNISNFSVEETPFAAAILLDTSGSMERRMSLARAAAINFLNGMREEDVASVYRFDTKVEQLQDFSPERDLPPLAFSMSARGMTALNDAVLRAAVDLSKRAEKRRAIVVLSDGGDNHSSASANKALAAALAANATIYTVDMSDPQTTQQERLLGIGALKFYAAQSGGRFISSPGGRALSEAFSSIVEELSNQYTIGYQSSNRARDGRWREIQISVARPPEATARTRRGYRAPKS